MGTLAIGLLAGCSALVAPAGDPDNPAVPPAWAGAADQPGPGATAADTLAAWWRRFDDPTLSALVTDALRANNDLRSAAAALRQARALREVQAAALPSLPSAAASAQRNRANGASANRFQAELDASWVPDVAGGTRAAVAAADADARASAASFGDTQVSVAAEVALAYIELRSAQVRLGIARDNLASQQDTLQIADWRSRPGSRPADVVGSTAPNRRARRTAAGH